MGLNDSGQLGDGTNTDRNTPTFIDGPKISIADLNQSFPMPQKIKLSMAN